MVLQRILKEKSANPGKAKIDLRRLGLRFTIFKDRNTVPTLK